MVFLDTAASDGSRGVPYLYDDDESVADGHFSASESGIVRDYARFVDMGRGRAPFWRQYLVLLKRDFHMAVRDPALYFLQCMLVLLFGFLVGAVFLRIKFRVDKSLQNVSGALLWMVFINAYMQIFKVAIRRYLARHSEVYLIASGILYKLMFFISFPSLLSPFYIYTSFLLPASLPPIMIRSII